MASRTKLRFMELTPDEFEEFVCEVFKAMPGVKWAQTTGKGSEKEDGWDVIGEYHDGMTLGIQCKREKDFGPAKFKKAVKKAVDAPRDKQVLALGRKGGPSIHLQKEVAEYADWEPVLGEHDLSDLPDDEEHRRIVRRYFGQDGLQTCFGNRENTALVTAETYHRNRLREDSLFHFRTPFQNVEANTNALNHWLDHKTLDALIVAGPGGVGKSRTVYEFVTRQSEAEVRYVSGNNFAQPSLWLQNHPNLILVIEDAHRFTKAPALLKAAASHPNPVRFILTTRLSRVDALEDQWREAGVDTYRIHRIELEPPEITSIIKATLPEENRNPGPHWVFEVARLASGCALLAVLATEIILREKIPISALTASRDMEANVFRTFGEEIRISLDVQMENGTWNRFLHFVACLGAMNDETIQTLADAVGSSPDVIRRALSTLEDVGLGRRIDPTWPNDVKFRLVPDLWGEYLAREACITKNGVTGFHQDVLDRFQPIRWHTASTLARTAASAPQRNVEARELLNDWAANLSDTITDTECLRAATHADPLQYSPFVLERATRFLAKKHGPLDQNDEVSRKAELRHFMTMMKWIVERKDLTTQHQVFDCLYQNYTQETCRDTLRKLAREHHPEVGNWFLKRFKDKTIGFQEIGLWSSLGTLTVDGLTNLKDFDIGRKPNKERYLKLTNWFCNQFASELPNVAACAAYKVTSLLVEPHDHGYADRQMAKGKKPADFGTIKKRWRSFSREELWPVIRDAANASPHPGVRAWLGKTLCVHSDLPPRDGWPLEAASQIQMGIAERQFALFCIDPNERLAALLNEGFPEWSDLADRVAQEFLIGSQQEDFQSLIQKLKIYYRPQNFGRNLKPNMEFFEEALQRQMASK